MRERPSARAPFAILATLTGVILVGCAPQTTPDAWTLEPLSFETGVQEEPTGPRSPHDSAQSTDLAFGFHVLSDDGANGFWAVSGSGWLHIDAEDRTRARFNVEPGDPLSSVTSMDSVSPTELVVVRDDGTPRVSLLDTSSMTMSDLPGEAPSGSGDAVGFGDYALADVAVDATTATAVLLRLAPRPDGSLDLDVLRIALTDGERALVHSEPIAWSGSGPDLPEVDVDVDDSGTILLATPDARVVLAADGTERARTPQSAAHPRVASAPDGTTLWWGDDARESDAENVIVGGSDEARTAIQARADCGSGGLRRDDALVMSDAAGEHPLPFLCGANAATWTGSSWIVATGGEGDGVLVRLRAPTG